jgi:hypothetical protein
MTTAPGWSSSSTAGTRQPRTQSASEPEAVAGGEVSCADLLLRPTWEIESMPVGVLLASQRYWGKQRCRELLRSVHLNELKRVGAMTERQRLMIVAALRTSRQHPTSRRAVERVQELALD